MGEQMTNEKLSLHYDSDEYHQEYEKPDYIYKSEVKTFFDAIDQKLSHLKIERPRFLDIGCSIGTALAEAQSRGYEAEGIEISPKAAEIARTCTQCKVYDIDIFSKDFNSLINYDVIYLNHTLEHFPNPQLCLERISQKLNENGLIWINIPTLSILRKYLSLFKRYHCLALGEHFSWFNSSSMEALAHKTNLKMIWQSGCYLKPTIKTLPASILARIMNSEDSRYFILQK